MKSSVKILLGLGLSVIGLIGFWAVRPPEVVSGATVFQVFQGGTGFTSARQGELLTGSSDHTQTLSKLATGSAGQVLTISGGLPTWVTQSFPAFNGIGLREGFSGSFTNKSSVSFESGAFNLSTAATDARVSLDYTNGPASRSIAQTISGQWLFSASPLGFTVSNNASVSSNLEVGGYASSSVYYAQSGTNALAAYSFGGDPNTGVYRISADALGLTAGGAGVQWNGLAFTPNTDAVRNMGTSALRWLGLFSVNASISGNFEAIGTASISGQLFATGGASFSGTVKLGGSATATTKSANNNSTSVATTAYVDSAVTASNPAVAVQAATTQASDTSGFTYSNGVSGIGATFTGSANTAITIDGYTFTALGQRLLVKNDTQSPSGAFNGVYYVTQVQTAILPPILTRALDYDMPSDINNTGAIPVINGTANIDTSWLLTSQVTTVGTDPLSYVQFSYNPSIIALLNANNAFSATSSTTFAGSVNVTKSITTSKSVTATQFQGTGTASNSFAGSLDISKGIRGVDLTASGRFLGLGTGSNSFAGSLNLSKSLTAGGITVTGINNSGKLFGTTASLTAGEFTSYASASKFLGNAFPASACTGTLFLQWATTGVFTCGTPAGSSTWLGLDASYIGGGQVKITSLSFDQNQFVLSNTASQGNVRLNWTNGPASRSATQSITGAWTFSNSPVGLTVTTAASISGNLSIGTAGTTGNSVIRMGAGTVASWSFGVDDVNLDKFTFSTGNNLGTNNALTLQGSGASFSQNVEVSGYASSSKTFGSGLTDCDDKNQTLQWTASGSAAGKFKCNIDQVLQTVPFGISTITANKPAVASSSGTTSLAFGTFHVTNQVGGGQFTIASTSNGFAFTAGSSGHIRGCQIIMSAVATAGKLEVVLQKNATVQAEMNFCKITGGSSTAMGTATTLGATAWTFVAGDRLGLLASTDAAFAPGTRAAQVYLDISYDSSNDLAEIYYSHTRLSPGTIVEIDPTLYSGVKVAQDASKVIGIVSEIPGYTLGSEKGPGYPIKVALAGRVPVTHTGSVKPGDYIGLDKDGTGKVVTSGWAVGQVLNGGPDALVFLKPVYLPGETLSNQLASLHFWDLVKLILLKLIGK